MGKVPSNKELGIMLTQLIHNEEDATIVCADVYTSNSYLYVDFCARNTNGKET